MSNTEKQHTPGPWKTKGWNNLIVNAIVNGQECTITTPGGSPNATLEELKSNAALIAAAPETAAERDRLKERLEYISHIISDNLQNILSGANVLEGEHIPDPNQIIQDIKKSVKEIREILDKH